MSGSKDEVDGGNRHEVSSMNKNDWDKLCSYTDDNDITVKNAIAYIVDAYFEHVGL